MGSKPHLSTKPFNVAQDADSPEWMLNSLLALIHGDSGNTTKSLGLRVSFEEAERLVIDLKKIDRRTRR